MEEVNLSRLHILSEDLNLHFENESIHSYSKSIEKIKKVFPELQEKEVMKIYYLLKVSYEHEQKKKIKAEIVVTAPAAITHQYRHTVGVLKEHIQGAHEVILLTGYSVSDFAKELIELLIKKTREGVKVKFYIDKNVDIRLFTAAIKNKDFELYKYRELGNFSNMHAKIVLIDNKTAFISSSNLSYNGIVNNLEIGSIISGKPVREIEKVFNSLLKEEFFIRVY